MSRHPSRDSINPTLFDMGKSEPAAAQANVERPYSEDGFFLGTSAFTANGWSGSFYPVGMKPSEYLPFYATKFRTVEIDSTYYGTPAVATVDGWYRRTPPDFIFAAKVPQVVTHEKVLANCDAEFNEFIERMGRLAEKLGPLLLQFPKSASTSSNRATIFSNGWDHFSTKRRSRIGSSSKSEILSG